jgi:hypothetical protein
VGACPARERSWATATAAQQRLPGDRCAPRSEPFWALVADDERDRGGARSSA